VGERSEQKKVSGQGEQTGPLRHGAAESLWTEKRALVSNHWKG